MMTTYMADVNERRSSDRMTSNDTRRDDIAKGPLNMTLISWNFSLI